jgi:hypothetical protein
VVTSTVIPPLQKDQLAKAAPSRVSIVSAKSDKLTIPWLPIIIGSVAIVGLLSLGGLTFWVRSVQNSAIDQAQDLVEGVGKSENPGDIQALKSDQENLQKVINLLETAPKFPILNVGALKTEFNEAQAQLAATDESIQAYEALIPQIQSTLDQFAGMDSGLDVGINYRDYGGEVRELKIALDRLGRQSGAKDHLVYQDLEAAYKHYEFAYNVWNYYIESDESNSFFPASSSYGAILINNYQVTSHDIVGRDYIYLDTALSSVWNAAGQKVEDAQSKL